MATEYWMLKFRGERPVDEIQSAIGRTGGLLVRIHVEGGETRVYFAADKSAIPDVSEGMKVAEAPTEIGADEVTELR